MTDTFTAAEQRFIDLSVPVLVAGEAKRLAEEEFDRATEVAIEAQKALGEKGKDIDHMHRLLLAAAEEAGFGPDSPVVQSIDEAYTDVVTYIALVKKASEAALKSRTDESRAV